MIASLTIVRYRKAFIPFALLSMAVFRPILRFTKHCTFWKLVGSGRSDTFDLKPDWQQWGLLAVWHDENAFKNFQQSFINKWWNRFGTEQWTILLEPLQSHGTWDGKEPFGKPNTAIADGPVAVLTRATIRTNRLKNFWNHVDDVTALMNRSKGYVMSIGVGEAPVFRQATFSVWESLDDVKAFAYGSKEHAEVIRKTREENWYSEELFARFKIIDSFGTLKGADPLAKLKTT